MNRRPASAPALRAIGALVLLAATAMPAAAGARWASLSLLAGTTAFDAHLADYQWDVAPRAAWGVQALAGVGPLSAGVRLWRAASTQELDLGGVADPRVHATSLELVTRARVWSAWGNDVLATASAGRLHLGWSPDEVVVSPSGSGSDVTAHFAPVHEWTGGAGAAVERALPGQWRAGVQVERRVFGLDTAHRAGATVVMDRESFGEWSARLELARVFGRN